MKYRYLIERSGDELFPYHVTTVNPEGEAQGSGRDFLTIDECKSYAQDTAQSGDEEDWGKRVELIWKDAPQAWQPDAILVSQYLEDMYPSLPS